MLEQTDKIPLLVPYLLLEEAVEAVEELRHTELVL
jgi:hypothetical protein